jgi:nonsense-mediated mRNA decay protein 3
MGKKFCPKCGRQTDEFYNGLCSSCSLSGVSIAKKLPNQLRIKECKICGKFLMNDLSGSTESLVESFLEDLIKQKEIMSATYRISGNKIFLTLKLKKGDFEKTEEKALDLITKKIICQTCSMKETGYFQATLQIRAPNELLPEIKSKIESQINYLNQYDNLAFISNFQETKNGFDFLIGSKNSANQIAKILKLKYKAKIKISRKLSGSIKGKKVYRDTILVKVE